MFNKEEFVKKHGLPDKVSIVLHDKGAAVYDEWDAFIGNYPFLQSEKPSNPKDAIGCDKLPLHLWPTTATAMGCLGVLEGMVKYGRTNWRQTGVRTTIYIDACKRHLDAYLEGEDNAPDSGTPHLANALACLAIIVDAQAAGKLTDDRNYNGGGYRGLVEKLTPHVKRIKDLFKEKNPKHYTIEDNK